MDADVRSLVAEHVDSVEKLELIALLCRHRLAWSGITAGEQLGIPAPLVEAALGELHRAGLVAVEPGVGYVWRPADAIAAAAERLTQLYDSDRAAVLTVLASTALERIRSSAAHTFADAFRLRGKNKGKPDA